MTEPARSAIPTPWVAIGKELGRARLDGYIWTADEEGMAEIEAEAAVRRERAKKERESRKRAAKARRDALSAERDERIQNARDEWSHLIQNGMSFEREEWIERNREFLDSKLGQVAFVVSPVVSKASYLAAVSAVMKIRRTGGPFKASVESAAGMWGADSKAVASLVRRATNRSRAGARRLRK